MYPRITIRCLIWKCKLCLSTALLQTEENLDINFASTYPVSEAHTSILTYQIICLQIDNRSEIRSLDNQIFNNNLFWRNISKRYWPTWTWTISHTYIFGYWSICIFTIKFHAVVGDKCNWELIWNRKYNRKKRKIEIKHYNMIQMGEAHCQQSITKGLIRRKHYNKPFGKRGTH